MVYPTYTTDEASSPVSVAESAFLRVPAEVKEQGSSDVVHPEVLKLQKRLKEELEQLRIQGIDRSSKPLFEGWGGGTSVVRVARKGKDFELVGRPGDAQKLGVRCSDPWSNGVTKSH